MNRWLRLPALVISAVLLAGCGGSVPPQQLCPRYEQLKLAEAESQASAPPTENVEALRTAADELQARVKELLGTLAQIEAASDGRLSQVIGQARQDLQELQAELTTARYQAANTLKAQLARAREEIRTDLAPLKNLLDAQCANG